MAIRDDVSLGDTSIATLEDFSTPANTRALKNQNETIDDLVRLCPVVVEIGFGVVEILYIPFSCPGLCNALFSPTIQQIRY